MSDKVYGHSTIFLKMCQNWNERILFGSLDSVNLFAFRVFLFCFMYLCGCNRQISRRSSLSFSSIYFWKDLFCITQDFFWFVKSQWGFDVRIISEFWPYFFHVAVSNCCPCWKWSWLKMLLSALAIMADRILFKGQITQTQLVDSVISVSFSPVPERQASIALLSSPSYLIPFEHNMFGLDCLSG